jgi:aerobic C4-dicarboxylate transport protein
MRILLAIDKFMSECRALVNFTGNMAWPRSWRPGGRVSLTATKLNAELSRQVDPSDD